MTTVKQCSEHSFIASYVNPLQKISNPKTGKIPAWVGKLNTELMAIILEEGELVFFKNRILLS